MAVAAHVHVFINWLCNSVCIWRTTSFFPYSTNVGYDWQIQLVMSPQIVLGLLTNVLQATADERIFIGAC